MKTNHLSYFSLIIMAAAIAAGCASAPSRFYTLNATAKADGSAAAPYAVVVGPVSVPKLVDHPQITVQAAPNRVELEEFNRWAEPLNQNIARAVAGDLALLLGSSQVTAAPPANFESAYRVSITIQRFESKPGQTALIEALWVVHKTGGAAQSGHTVVSEPVSEEGFDALVAAHSRALAKVSGDIAAAIRSEADAN